LAGMLLGPIGIAAALIYQYWAQIKNGAAAVWNWIRTVWPQLLTWLTYPFRMAWQYIQTAWSAIIAAAGTGIGWLRANWPLIVAILTGPVGLAVYTIVRYWNDLVGFIAGIPGRIAGIASGMWNSIYAAFRAMVNGIIDIWNGLHFTLPKI